MTDIEDKNIDPPSGSDDDDDDDDDGKNTKGGKSRRELPAGAVATLKAWLLSPEHFTHPYPTPQDQVLLMQKTGIDKKQLKNWFTNARRRIWKPMLKKQLEQGKITQTGTGVIALPGTPAAIASSSSTINDYTSNVEISNQTMQQNFQQVLQQQQNQSSSQQPQSFDSYSNYGQQQQMMNMGGTSFSNPFYQQGQFNYSSNNQNDHSMGQAHSIGSLPALQGMGSLPTLNKTDSHAVLMELFARDQDLVRQATEGAKQRQALQAQQQLLQGVGGAGNGTHPLGNQHPMNKLGGSSTLNKLGNVPSLNSWPHFSSVSSLNNLGTMTGVKSITNMSGADLVSQGSLNKKGNLAQVKSIESMGRADSYAFLEVFFDTSNSVISNQAPRGIKRDREDDDNVGLSLDGDESSPMPIQSMSNNGLSTSAAPVAAPLPADGKDKDGLKRAYDDALAARGLISVSRSSEKLTDLALPAKMQRTISQEYLKYMNSAGQKPYSGYLFSSNSPTPSSNVSSSTNNNENLFSSSHQKSTVFADPVSSSVEVPSTTKCALCNCFNVDTQLRPCGHMFHGRCLKPSLQHAIGAPQCPIDHVVMHSAVLAVPVDEKNINKNSTSAPFHPSICSKTET